MGLRSPLAWLGQGARASRPILSTLHLTGSVGVPPASVPDCGQDARAPLSIRYWASRPCCLIENGRPPARRAYGSERRPCSLVLQMSTALSAACGERWESGKVGRWGVRPVRLNVECCVPSFLCEGQAAAGRLDGMHGPIFLPFLLHPVCNRLKSLQQIPRYNSAPTPNPQDSPTQ